MHRWQLYLLVLMMIFGGETVFADDLTDNSKHCISIVRISDTQIIDNQHIRFNMNGGPDYINELPNMCPGLSPNSTFMYKTSLNELCDLDIITLLENIGGGFVRGPSCGLGKFVPVSENDSKDE